MRRIERDSLGDFSVPRDALYGCHTARAVENFPFKNPLYPLSEYKSLLKSILNLKDAYAQVNERKGLITSLQRNLIQLAVVNIIDSHLNDSVFPISLIHGGGGTSANMNVNEVIANVGGKINGESLGSYKSLSPTETVNFNQSTNEIIPTALRLSILCEAETLHSRMKMLDGQFDQIIARVGDLNRMVRTCFQDSIVGTFDDLFGATRKSFSRLNRELEKSLLDLNELNIGGGIAGIKKNSDPTLGKSVLIELKKKVNIEHAFISENFADSAQNVDTLVATGDVLERISRQVIRVSNFLRILASGPQAGIGEILIEPVQPGSSAMPGKVNPVLPEHSIQLAMLTCGRINTLRMTLDLGDPDLNVWEMVNYLAISDSLSLLALAIDSLARTISGVSVNKALSASVSSCDAPLNYNLSKQIGFEAVASRLRKATISDGGRDCE